MKKIILDKQEYQIIEDYKNAFEKDIVLEKITDYFEPYDYIVGDWAYGKLRLKGFCETNNPIYKSYNDFKNYKSYLKEQCAYDCKYFILKKIK